MFWESRLALRGDLYEGQSTNINRINTGTLGTTGGRNRGPDARRHGDRRNQTGERRADHILPLAEIGRQLSGRIEPGETGAYGWHARAIAGAGGHGSIDCAANADRNGCPGGRAAKGGAGRPSEHRDARTRANRQDRP